MTGSVPGAAPPEPAATLAADYDQRFYAGNDARARESARAVLTQVFGYVRPASVVDVGCGTGQWLRSAADLVGCEVLGLDSPGVPVPMLAIPADCFVPGDLGAAIEVGRRFDLAISLEVAEHLPAARAEGFVRDLTTLSSAVLFSAALPGQGGVGHVHERWPSYWVGLFAAQGYEPWDVVRPVLWDADEVAYWYRQNTFLFVDPAVHGTFPDRRPAIVDLVHPELLRRWATAPAPTPAPARRPASRTRAVLAKVARAAGVRRTRARSAGGDRSG